MFIFHWAKGQKSMTFYRSHSPLLKSIGCNRCSVFLRQAGKGGGSHQKSPPNHKVVQNHMEAWKSHIMVHHEPFHLQERGRGKASHCAAQPEPHTGARGTWHRRRGRHLYHQSDPLPTQPALGTWGEATTLPCRTAIACFWSGAELRERLKISPSFVCLPFFSFPDKLLLGSLLAFAPFFCMFSSSSVG